MTLDVPAHMEITSQKSRGVWGRNVCSLVSVAFILPISYVNPPRALFWLLVIYWSEFTTSERSRSECPTHWRPAPLQLSAALAQAVLTPTEVGGAGPAVFWWGFVSLCSVCGQGEHSAMCSQVRAAGESGGSGSVTPQVQFRTGQTEALVTLIIVREHWDGISPSAPPFSAHWWQGPSLYTVREKTGEENSNFNANKQSQVSIPGRCGSANSSLTATVLRRSKQ